jgi:hypothetical protein
MALKNLVMGLSHAASKIPARLTMLGEPELFFGEKGRERPSLRLLASTSTRTERLTTVD